MESFCIQNFGPIESANINFGDLTILVGPQASGKSLFLELLKYVIDKDNILDKLRKYNYIINTKNPHKILDIYFGDGMHKIIQPNTRISHDNNIIPIDSLAKRNTPKRETIFYIPAQRILSIADGRPKNFTEFDMSTPYIVRSFSETLRTYLLGGMGDPNVLFPINRLLKPSIKASFDKNIFHGGQIIMEEVAGQKKMKLNIASNDNMSIPFMTWSAGQKEFMPLLIAFYCLSEPISSSFRKYYNTVIIEEPEMGLHPQAIQAVLLTIINLLQQGLQVILSTHSTIFLDFAWAFNFIKKSSHPNKEQAMYEMFNISRNNDPTLFQGLFEKQISTFYFSRTAQHNKVQTMDISSLDAGSNNEAISEWGGLTQFSSKAAELVAEYL